MEGISEQLKKQIPAIPKGGRVTYESLGKHVDGLNEVAHITTMKVPASSRIYDPWSIEIGEGKNKTYEGSMIEINYHESTFGETPKLGTIIFDKNNSGRVSIHDQDKAKKTLHEYLFLCSFNLTNNDKPWGKGNKNPLFKFIDKSLDAKKDNDLQKDIVRAKAIIIDKDDKWMEMIRAAKYTEMMSLEEVLQRLLKECEANPSSIFSLDKDKGIALKADLKAAVKHKIINKSNVNWYWVNDKGHICGIDAKDPYESLVKFLTDNKEKGHDTRILLKNLLEEKISKVKNTDVDELKKYEKV